ncbi:MAG: ATP-binding protein [Bacteroidales bacterium]
MHKYIKRLAESRVLMNMDVFPAVAILGPRQCGKSTLIKNLAKDLDSFVCLDLQNRDDIAKLAEPGLFFKANEAKTICLDEVQLLPELFRDLRSIIDQNRRNGRFILLGSASRNLLQKSSESLAGRIGMIDLSPFLLQELIHESEFELSRYWFRGGFPDSYLARSDEASSLWLENFLRTYAERDIPQLGFQIPAQQLMRMLMMTAHSHGQLFNASKLGESLGLTHPTIKRYLDLLIQTFILRALPPWESNIKKRLVKSPKVFVRDTGLLHRLLQINDYNQLLGHPVLGASWEGMVIENICNHFPEFEFSFYRSATGDEMDLIMQKPGLRIAIECKASTAPKPEKSFYRALEVIKPDKTYIVAPVKGHYPYKTGIDVCGLSEIIDLLT